MPDFKESKSPDHSKTYHCRKPVALPQYSYLECDIAYLYCEDDDVNTNDDEAQMIENFSACSYHSPDSSATVKVNYLSFYNFCYLCSYGRPYLGLMTHRTV